MKHMLRRWLAGLLSVIMAFTLLPTISLAATEPFENAGGTGDANSPYLISSKEHLESFRDYVNDGNSCASLYIKLTTNIDLGSVEWTPIGIKTSSNPYPEYCYFNGTFDGDKHTISGLLINQTSVEADPVGLFEGIDSNGTVKNLTVSGSVTGHISVGGIAGINRGTIENCHNDASITGIGSIGGIAGDNNPGTIQRCYNTGKISGNNSVGGITGNLQGSIQNCYNLGEITSNGSAGGVAGSLLEECQLLNCFNIGNIQSEYFLVGGIVGDGSAGIYTNCYYLQGTSEKGVGPDDSASGVSQKTAEEFFKLASEPIY